MKFTYLGTAASECFPAMFCNCAHCQKARRLKGKNIRTRSQALVNDDFLIDLPADTYMHAVQNDIQMDKISLLCVTHSHTDHLAPNELIIRGGAYAHDMRSQTLHIILGKSAYDELVRVTGGLLSQSIKDKMVFTIAQPYQTVEVGKYKITPLPARHQIGTDAYIYCVQTEGKALLYAHDTGYLYEEVIQWLAQKGLVFDFVSLDCTNVYVPIDDEGGHMGIPNNVRLVERLKEISVIDEQTKIYINHFSHNAMPLQEYLESEVKEYGFGVAYDGLSIEI